MNDAVTDQLRTVVKLLAADPSDDFTFRRISVTTGLPVNDVRKCIKRARRLGWVTQWPGADLLHQINPDALDEIAAAGIRIPAPGTYTLHREPVTVPTGAEDDEPVRTLTELVATEPRWVVDYVCRHLGWPSPYEEPEEPTAA
mgnify:CR=1 FL=1